MNIGTVRRALFTPWPSSWNSFVRSATAWLEARGWFTEKSAMSAASRKSPDE